MTISLAEAVSKTTLRVKVRREASTRWRIWLGCRILVMAAHIIGCKIDVEVA